MKPKDNGGTWTGIYHFKHYFQNDDYAKNEAWHGYSLCDMQLSE